jgi:hypothetical protein
MKRIICFVIIFLLFKSATNLPVFSEPDQHSAELDILQQDTIRHFVGEFYGGGIVFHLDNSGHHGMICSISDIQIHKQPQLPGERIKDSNETSSLVSIDSNICGTDAIRCCDDYTNSNIGTGVFSYWYLPAITDLETLYKVKGMINKVIESCDKNITEPLTKTFWSSSKKFYERYSGDYWLFDIENGNRVTTSIPRPFSTGIRAVQTF